MYFGIDLSHNDFLRRLEHGSNRVALSHGCKSFLQCDWRPRVRAFGCADALGVQGLRRLLKCSNLRAGAHSISTDRVLAVQCLDVQLRLELFEDMLARSILPTRQVTGAPFPMCRPCSGPTDLQPAGLGLRFAPWSTRSVTGRCVFTADVRQAPAASLNVFWRQSTLGVRKFPASS